MKALVFEASRWINRWGTVEPILALGGNFSTAGGTESRLRGAFTGARRDLAGSIRSIGTALVTWIRVDSPLRHYYGGYILFNLVDIILTGLILAAGGKEVNPLASYLLNHHGPVIFVLVKLLLVAITIASCELLRRLSRSACFTVIRLGVFVYFGLMIWEARLVYHVAPHLMKLHFG